MKCAGSWGICLVTQPDEPTPLHSSTFCNYIVSYGADFGNLQLRIVWLKFGHEIKKTKKPVAAQQVFILHDIFSVTVKIIFAVSVFLNREGIR